MAPAPPEAGFSFSGISVTNASVVSMRAEIEAAFCRAVRVTLVGSTTPAFTRSSYLPVATLNPSLPTRFLTSWMIRHGNAVFRNGWATVILGQDDVASGRSERGLNGSRSAGVKKGLFIFVCEFVHYVPARRKNTISILSAYSNTFAAFWPVRFPGLRSAWI